MQIVPISSIAKNPKPAFDSAEKGEITVVTRFGKPIALIIPYQPLQVTIRSLAEQEATLLAAI